MKINLTHVVLCLALSPMASVRAQDSYSGDTKLACEALLCLAASGRPTECIPSIRRYFSISFRKFSDTLKGRLNFLNLCPIVSGEMSSFKSAIVNGAGRCDAASINQANFFNRRDEEYVSNVMPPYCAAYYGNGLVQTPTPVYVGEPTRGGYWVEKADYASALRAYNEMRARIEAEAQRQR